MVLGAAVPRRFAGSFITVSHLRAHSARLLTAV